MTPIESLERVKQVNFRMKAQLYEDLSRVAHFMGTDMTSLLNTILTEHVGEYLERAEQLLAKNARARAALDTAEVPTDNPVVRELVHQGQMIFDKFPDDEQRRKKLAQTVLLIEAKTFPQKKQASLEVLVRQALELLRQDEERRQIRHEIEEFAREGAGEKRGKKP
jgi:hypothetical protein